MTVQLPDTEFRMWTTVSRLKRLRSGPRFRGGFAAGHAACWVYFHKHRSLGETPKP